MKIKLKMPLAFAPENKCVYRSDSQVEYIAKKVVNFPSNGETLKIVCDSSTRILVNSRGDGLVVSVDTIVEFELELADAIRYLQTLGTA